MKHKLVRTHNVVGIDVQNAQDENLGKIEDLVLNKQTGHVEYVVLSFGGFLGMGDKLFALPWSIFSFDDSKDCFIINVEKEKLKNSPGFDKDQWPNMSDEKWGSSIHSYYGTKM
ncbi:MAG: PRC-barrel domain-containing protein [Legionellaceae bacterium]|nr:PRC-barrel domain-containing protein [Legionellaceae bacterium]